MQNHYFTSDKKIAMYTGYASLLLNCSQKELKKFFSGYPTCLMKYVNKEERTKILEVELEKGNLTLTCWLNLKNTCYSLFLFPKPSEVIHYALYFNTHYSYDSCKNCWILPEYCIEIHRDRLHTGFRFYIPS